MKLFEQPTSRETLDRLPEMPDDVKVPDDISGLKLPVSVEPMRPTTGVRWLRWLPALVLLAVGAVALTMLVSDGGSESADVSSQQLVQESIDAALAANAVNVAVAPSSQQLVQESIDAALAANAVNVTVTPALDGPGGNSLFIPTIPPVVEEVTEELPFGGPGGNSLRAP